uniref:Uncharacterized protein n=1 Tax=Candidatus Methanogaster sp. ANME-2c ERB4 TaxID=2759911 RepID=A0A7G9YIU9_9EURY|nr:hypothetical protein DBNCDMDK_00021 [Methanosarcinales archaeon ANME-2c ERB4]
MLLGVVLLLELLLTYVSEQFIVSVFTGELFRDTVIGSAVRSISAGNPITSYIIGGALMKEGVSLFVITAFIVAWVTVSIVQFPAEAAFLGRRLWDNIIQPTAPSLRDPSLSSSTTRTWYSAECCSKNSMTRPTSSVRMMITPRISLLYEISSMRPRLRYLYFP